MKTAVGHNSVFRRLASLSIPAIVTPLFLFLLSVLAYGVMFRSLGFYWDELPYIWIADKLGAAGLARYFSTNRPVWGAVYQLTTAVLGSAPWQWQLFGLFWRWLSAVSVWWLVWLTWRRHSVAAVWVATLFLVYPGFDQQPIAMMYGHFFIVITAFFLSCCLMILSLRRPTRYWHFTLPALLLSAFNLLAMEYFFLLDLLRPVLLWFVLAKRDVDWRERKSLASLLLGESETSWQTRLKQTLRAWLPYLIVFVAAVLWRAVIFKYQTQNYQPTLLTQIGEQPVQAVTQLLKTIGVDLFSVIINGWAKAFQMPDLENFGARSLLFYWAIIALSVMLVLLFLFRLRPQDQEPPPAEKQAWGLQAIFVGALALLLAGPPFWLTGLPIAPSYPLSRFTLPFMLGVSLVLAGLLQALTAARAARIILLGIFVGYAVGYQFQVANAFRRDWNTQKALFWQMAWRMPSIEPHTALLANDLPTRFTSDNSLSAVLNYIYAPQNRSEDMYYMLYFPSIRTKTYFKDYQPGREIQHNYLAATFRGNTSQVIAFYFQPPACLRVLDAEIERDNIMLPEAIKTAMRLSSATPIRFLPEGQGYTPPIEIYGAELAHGWCYYFEKADLARQMQDWAQVALLGEEAFCLQDHPNDPVERTPFIEAYAHLGQWQRALELTRESAQVTELVRPVLCALWQRIDRETPASAEKDAAVRQVRQALACP